MRYPYIGRRPAASATGRLAASPRALRAGPLLPEQDGLYSTYVHAPTGLTVGQKNLGESAVGGEG